jgi:hypothetical protein
MTDLLIGGRYNWKGQPEHLVYMGYNWSGNGFWHQFALVNDPEVVWCEVLPTDTDSFEKSKIEGAAPMSDKPYLRNLKTREGYDIWDKLCAVPRYGFIHSPDNSRVLKAEGLGNWIDRHAAQEVVDEAQDELNGLRASRAADKARIAELESAVESAADIAGQYGDALVGGGLREDAVKVWDRERQYRNLLDAAQQSKE